MLRSRSFVDAVKWRKRVGVEPTQAGTNPTRTGFEDREIHRNPCASAVTIVNGASAEGPADIWVRPFRGLTRSRACRWAS